ncbi:DUF1493 family protein [Paludisphaera mucosa]|uniref:DUF1493 family protein n=1 Tax=Paludisphaera mucosa TaxID=3030827 RepID=A0ABT6FCA1_9BACT|nr:DUF1493 family protein [Paludisphaera mucosa]MDG3005214.1 DUF1493 family protein [Paludisphaera mucosa]
MDAGLETRVKEFLAKELATHPARFSLRTTLLADLGIDGEDGWELIEAFGKEFEVDLSGFDASKHFGPEAGGTPFTFVYAFIQEFLLRKDPHDLWGLSAITIGDLIEAAEQETWLK